MSSAPVVVTGIGGVTAVGDEIAQSVSSVRAGLMGFAEHPSHRPTGSEEDPEGPLLRVAAVEGIDPALPGPDRLLDLAVRALHDLARNVGEELSALRDARLLVSLPAQDSVTLGWDLAHAFVGKLRDRTRLPFEAPAVVESGSPGMFELLPAVARVLGRSRCIVLGVESWLAPDRLRLLDDEWRAKSQRNVDGFIPGEAATALLVEPTKWAEQRGATALAGIAGVGFGREPETFSSDKQSSGRGLAEALRTVVSGRTPPRWVLCDLNGESYRAIEWGLVQVRLGAEMEGVEKLLHPANCHGDIGAATGGALVAIAATAFRRGYAPPGDAVLFCGSDGDLRAATRLERV